MTDPRLIDAAARAERLAQQDPPADQDDWLSDPANARALAAVSAARDTSMGVAGDPDLLALRHAAVARAALGRPDRERRRWWPTLAAACLAVAAAPIATWYAMRADPAIPRPAPVLSTEVGQRLIVSLPDGSRMTLSTASRVRIAYTDSERRLVLEKGQAFFDVAKHQARPFVVDAGGEQVTAHGTEFDVKLDRDAVRVALVEGKVSVASGAQGRPVMMKPDDVLVARAGTVSVRHATGRAATLSSWSEGRLVFDNEPLGEAVAELNRYGSPRITIADPRAAKLRISASLRTGEVEPFLDALALGFPVTVTRHDDGGATIMSRR